MNSAALKVGSEKHSSWSWRSSISGSSSCSLSRSIALARSGSIPSPWSISKPRLRLISKSRTWFRSALKLRSRSRSTDPWLQSISGEREPGAYATQAYDFK